MSKASVKPIYADALNLAENWPATPKSIARVAAATSPEAARWAFTQWELRDRAKSKFSHAREMFFDREGLEMATHERLAAYHASRFPSDATVCDLTTGIGADLIALARRGPAVGFEIDPDRAELARHNLAVHGLEATVRSESWESSAGAEYFFLDPARRSGGKRTLDPREFLPNPAEVIQRLQSANLGVVKLSPMLPDPFLESLGPRQEFLSFGGECREALVFVGSEVEPGRFAIHIESNTEVPAGGAATGVEVPLEYLFEADPAAIRAHALGTLAGEFGLTLLGDSNGYLTGRSLVSTPWLRAYRTLSCDRFDVSQLKTALAAMGSSTPVLKQKGAGQDLDALRRKLSLKGSRELAVALYTIGKSLRYAVLEPVR